MDDHFFMSVAIKEAIKSFNKNEVPIGAIIVKDGDIISRGHNLTESRKCQLYHAENIAILKATKVIKNWRLEDTTIYTTLEPCIMCIGLINLSRIERLVFGVCSSKFGFKNSIVDNKLSNLYCKVKDITFGINQDEIKDILNSFFKNKR
jgi:tRNA(adenine34) deaminase